MTARRSMESAAQNPAGFPSRHQAQVYWCERSKYRKSKSHKSACRSFLHRMPSKPVINMTKFLSIRKYVLSVIWVGCIVGLAQAQVSDKTISTVERAMTDELTRAKSELRLHDLIDP